MRLKGQAKLIAVVGFITLMVWGQIGNNPPNSPILISPANNATIAVHQQIFRVSATDADGDRLKFKIVVMELREPPSPPVGRGGARIWVFDQTQDPSGWDKESYQSSEVAVLVIPTNKSLPGGRYLWWAFAYDGKNWSQISEQRKLRIVSNLKPSPPTLIAPSDNEIVHNLIFKIKSEDADKDLLKFKIIVAELPEPPSPPRRSSAKVWVYDQTQDPIGWDKENYRSGEIATLVVPENRLIPKGEYFWWALAYDGKEWSEISSRRKVRIVNQTPSVPVLVSPSSGATSVPIFKVKAEDADGDLLKFKIIVSESLDEPPSPPRGRKGTQIWVYDQTQDPAGWDKESYRPGEIATLFVPTYRLMPSGDYIWWALVYDGREWSEISEKRRIKIISQISNYAPSVPKLIHPPNDAIVSPTPLFKLMAYDPNGDNIKFQIEVTGKYSYTYETSFFVSGQEVIYIVPSNRRLSEGPWHWRARAIDSKGLKSDWSQPRTFSVSAANNAPSNPVLISPVKNQIVSPVPTFILRSEDPDNDEVMFEIRLERSGMTPKVFKTGWFASGSEAIFTIPSALIEGEWRWKAKAIDKRGAESGWSETRSFTVERPTIEVNPTSLSFMASQGAKPLSQTFSLTNKGSSDLKWTLTKNKSWLSLKPTNGILGKGSSVDITVTVDPSGLSPQTYQDTVSIKAGDGSVLSQVIVTLKVLSPSQPGEKFTATVKVVDEDNKPIEGAVVHVFNEEHKHITTSSKTNKNGEVVIRDLRIGYVLRAEKKVATFVLNENGVAVEKTNLNDNDRLFCEVFLTSDEVKDDGTIDNDIKGREDLITLTIKRHNALIKFHLELAFEWDVDKDTVDFWVQALRHASNLLYDVTDGHACIGSVKILSNHRYQTSLERRTGVPRNAIQVFADNEVYPHVCSVKREEGISGVHIGRQWQGRIGDWRTIQPELLGFILAHEFGHSLLLLPDEYINGDKKCVEPEIDQLDKYGRPDDPNSAVACLMAAGFDFGLKPIIGDTRREAWSKPSELCNGRPGRHTAQELKKLVPEIEIEEGVIKPIEKKLIEDCWTRFKRIYEDPRRRWIIRTPVDRGVDVVPGPAKVVSYTRTNKLSRLIEVVNKKDAIGEEIEAPTKWQSQGKRVKLEIVRMPEKQKMNARVGIYSSERFIYQGRTPMPGHIEIEGYRKGDVIEVFAADRFDLFRDLQTPQTLLQVWPVRYSNAWQIVVKISEVGQRRLLSFQVRIDPQRGRPESEVYLQLIVQDNKVLKVRDMPLLRVDKYGYEWRGEVELDDKRKVYGYFRLSRKKGGAAIACASFGKYNIDNPPFPIAESNQFIRLANGLGLLEAPNATSGAEVSFVVTSPFVFGQGELIPRSFAYTFDVLSGNLGSNSRLELIFDPIEQSSEDKSLKLYQFSETTQKWEPVEAEILPTEGVAVLTPARSGTYCVMEMAIPVPSFVLPAGLQMIGIPFMPSRMAPVEVFGLSSEAIRLARWKPQVGYVFYQPQNQQQDHEVAFILPGKGYWVKFDRPVTIPQQGGLLPEEGIALSLKAGWNQIANPFLQSLNWSVDEIYVRGSNDEVKTLYEAVKAGWIEGYAWGWKQDENNPFKGKYVLVYDTSIMPGVQGQLEPWKGYWVYAHQDCELILPPPSITKGRGARDKGGAVRSNGWTMKLVAKVGDESGEAILGVLQGSRRLAVGLPPEPPEGSSNVQVLLLNNGAPLAVDVRNGMRQRQDWDVVVRFGTRDGGRGTRQNKEVTLTFDGIGYAPKDVSLWLVDLVTGKRLYMRTQSAYWFTPHEGETSRRFKVVAEIGNTRPLQVVGLKAVPMRGRSLAIQFALTKLAQTQVEILTLTGRKVAVLEAGQSRKAGQHQIVWQGRGKDGELLPASVYLVRVIATDEEGRQVQAATIARLK